MMLRSGRAKEEKVKFWENEESQERRYEIRELRWGVRETGRGEKVEWREEGCEDTRGCRGGGVERVLRTAGRMCSRTGVMARPSSLVCSKREAEVPSLQTVGVGLDGGRLRGRRIELTDEL